MGMVISALVAQTAGTSQNSPPVSPTPLPAVKGSAVSSASTVPVVSLDTCVNLALSKGSDLIIAQKTLDAARASHALNLSKDAFSLGASGGYTVGSGFSYTTPDAVNTSLLGKAAGGLSASASTAGVSQTVQGGLTLSKGNASPTNPYSKIALTATESVPPATAVPNSPNTVIGISVGQTLWDGYPGGQTKAVIDKSVLTLKGKELQTQVSRSSIVANVKKAYVTLLGAQNTLALRKSIAEKQNSILTQINAVYAIKQASSIDLLNAQINAKSAELDVESAQHDVALATQRLANLIGYSPDAQFVVADIPDPSIPAKTLDDAIATALAKRSEIALAELNRQSSSIDLKLAAGQGQPGVSVSGGVAMALGQTTTGTSGDAEYATVGVKLTLPLLDGGAVQAQVASSQALVDLYQTQAQQLRLSIAADVRDAFWQLTIQSKKVEVAKQSQDLYEAQLKLVQAQNSFGTATNQDLMTAAVNAANAEVSYASAKNSYLLAVITLETAMGL